MQKHTALLERLIDYDLKEAQRKAELAHLEQERKRIEVIWKSLDKNESDSKISVSAVAERNKLKWGKWGGGGCWN